MKILHASVVRCKRLRLKRGAFVRYLCLLIRFVRYLSIDFECDGRDDHRQGHGRDIVGTNPARASNRARPAGFRSSLQLCNGDAGNAFILYLDTSQH